jgi:cardiolipin synthase
MWVAVSLGALNVAMAVMLWSIRRRRNPHLTFDHQLNVEDLAGSIAGVAQSTVTEGNRIELVQNGEFFDWLFRDLQRAQETVHFETFLTLRGEMTHRMTDVLCERARAGVEVRMMLDGTGGRHFGHSDLRRLREAGVKVRKYHPIRISNLGLLNNRDHRKLVVIDGRIGYVGGHCLTDAWMGNAQDKQHYRDISARVEGPVVAQMQSAFVENWIEETAEVPAGPRYFPRLDSPGETKAHLVWASPTGMPSAVKLLYSTAIRAATKRILIQNPYFLPDPDQRDALLKASRRGVEVRVMIPATDASDAPLVQHASHHHYGTLLSGGIRLFDYQPTLIHQKVMVIDGKWAALGSANFDDRSLEVNDEVVLVMYDERLASELEETFENDLRNSIEIDLEGWTQRPVSHRMTDFLSFLFNEQM